MDQEKTTGAGASEPEPDAVRCIFTRREAAELNERKGFYFFTPGAMRFFHSRICRRFYPDGLRGCSYFVTSEQFTASNGWTPGRKFTVRAIDWASGNVHTIGPNGGRRRSEGDGFQLYDTARQAQAAARRFARRPAVAEGVTL